MTDFKFPIYICEDNPKQRQWLADLIERYVMIEDYPMVLACVTGDPDKLLNSWTDRRGNAVFFLDIDLQHELTGIFIVKLFLAIFLHYQLFSSILFISKNTTDINFKKNHINLYPQLSF